MQKNEYMGQGKPHLKNLSLDLAVFSFVARFCSLFVFLTKWSSWINKRRTWRWLEAAVWPSGHLISMTSSVAMLQFIWCKLKSRWSFKKAQKGTTVVWSPDLGIEPAVFRIGACKKFHFHKSMVSDSGSSFYFIYEEQVLPCSPHMHWHHSGIQRTCPGRRSRACRLGEAAVGTVGWGPTPQNWCCGFRWLLGTQNRSWENKLPCDILIFSFANKTCISWNAFCSKSELFLIEKLLLIIFFKSEWNEKERVDQMWRKELKKHL